MERDYLNGVRENIIEVISLTEKKKEMGNCIWVMGGHSLDLLVMGDQMELVFMIMELILKEKWNLLMEK